MKRQHPIKNSLSKYQQIKKHHKFLRDSSSSQQQQSQPQSQNKKKENNKDKDKDKQIAKLYYDSLFKEYSIVDLSLFESGKIGCRWRTQKQVLKKKGESICAALKCSLKAVSVFEMNFGYVENGQKMNALVKVSVCEKCGVKLNWTKKLKEVKMVKQQYCDDDQ